MAWSFTSLPYGWKLAVGITLTGATIFTADNLRRRFTQIDDVELDLAVAERSLATQYGTNALGEPLYRVDPPKYIRSWYSNSYVSTVTNGVTNWTAVLHTNIFTNAVGFRTDRAKAVARDATIKALVPFYVDANSVYDGTTNIVMLTVTGLWAQLQIGDKTNQFTSVPAIGTNPATYGELPWRIYEADLVERYKVLYSLEETFSAASSKGSGYWRGEGFGSNYSDAIADAATNYTFIAGLTPPLGQWCKVAFWSNYVSHVIPGEGTAPGGYVPLGWGRDYGSNLIRETIGYFLTMTHTGTVTNLIVTCTNEPTMGTTTNIVVTGDTNVSPNCLGEYTVTVNYADHPAWGSTNGFGIYFNVNGPEFIIGIPYAVPPASCWYLWNYLSGPPTGNYWAYGEEYSGFPNAAWGDSFSYTVSVARASSAGYYTYLSSDTNGHGSWSSTNGFTIGWDSGLSKYVITGAQIDFFNATHDGAYTATGHIGTASATEDLVELPGPQGSCAGQYHKDRFGTVWTGPGGWTITEGTSTFVLAKNGDTNNYYSKGGSTAEGPYGTITGTNLYGVPEAGSIITEESYHWEDNWGTHTWGHGPIGTNGQPDTNTVYNTNTIFYQVWMTKGGWTNTVVVSSNLAYSAEHYVYSGKPTLGTTNFYNNEGLVLADGEWKLVGTGSGDGVNTESEAVGYDFISAPPVAAPEPTDVNTSTCEGFFAVSNNVLLDWTFLYCKDLFW